MRFICTIFLLMTSFSGFSQESEVLNNQTIIELTKSNVGKDVIKNLISTSVCKFDIGANDIIKLG